MSTVGRVPGLDVPASRTQYAQLVETIRVTTVQISQVASDTAPFLRRNLPAVIIQRAKGGTESGEAQRQARAIARQFTVIASLAKMIARLSVRAARQYDAYVQEAEQRAKQKPSGTFDADA